MITTMIIRCADRAAATVKSWVAQQFPTAAAPAGPILLSPPNGMIQPCP